MSTTDEALDAIVRAASIASYYTMTATSYTVDACDAAVTALKKSDSYRLLRELVRSTAPPNYPGLNPWKRRDRAFWLHDFDCDGTPVYATHAEGASATVMEEQGAGEDEFVDLYGYANAVVQAPQPSSEILTPTELAQVHLCRERAIKGIKQGRPRAERDAPLTQEDESYVLRCWFDAFENVVKERKTLDLESAGGVQQDAEDDAATADWEDVSDEEHRVFQAGDSQSQGLELDCDADTLHESDP